ncbi:chromate efflux transporter [Cellvibrio polysaccharolyticus]|uniref:Chromate transporter n=1 Tax=Cellvibrio polysaccharolyticus TaxID=2082724 RepID=A0A928V2E1_9GAMM|nr:chromate efflux transporter [Cellvibrio polysaccharolyticus]MBE8717520.1 chromate transporter [Cellvibrio polysaccharolyticus]
MTNTTRIDHRPWAVFWIFLRLGMTSFGGPIAHLGYFRDEFVVRRQWLGEQSYADLVALCQFLPGPTSSQVGMALGLSRCGYTGALAAWTGFTLPSAILLILFALGINHYGDAMSAGVLQGLKVAAVAVVAQAVWGMARHLCPDVLRVFLMLVAAAFVLLLPSVWGQPLVIILMAAVGMLLFKPAMNTPLTPLPIMVGRNAGLIWLGLFFSLLLGLPLLALLFPSQTLLMVDAFYRAGALVFGGGHVVLPLLQAEVVPAGWVDQQSFLAGYGAAQAIPGPLFSFAAFLGAASSGWLGGFICLVAIFVPSFLLIVGVLPFWQQLRANARMQAALCGANAAVVGLLLAALYQPVWTSAIQGPQDIALAAAALAALMIGKLPSWLVVMACGIAGWGFSAVL